MPRYTVTFVLRERRYSNVVPGTDLLTPCRVVYRVFSPTVGYNDNLCVMGRFVTRTIPLNKFTTEKTFTKTLRRDF